MAGPGVPKRTGGGVTRLVQPPGRHSGPLPGHCGPTPANRAIRQRNRHHPGLRSFHPTLDPAGPRGAAGPRQGAASRLGRRGAGRRAHHRHGLHPLQLRNQRQDAGRAAEPGVSPQPGDPLVLQRVGERGPPAGLPGPHKQRGPGAPRTDRGRGVGAGGKVRPDAAGPGGTRRAAGQLPIALHDLGPIRPAPDSSAQG